ncbi:MAG: ATP-grasp domain-containing protein, partial [Nitrospirales bacterium]
MTIIKHFHVVNDRGFDGFRGLFFGHVVAPFKMELSVVLARSLRGDIQLYPLAENAHRQNILHTTRVPARVANTIRLRAEELAVSLSEALDYCGVMAVELFLLQDDTLLINEIAPRPHNSG